MYEISCQLCYEERACAKLTSWVENVNSSVNLSVNYYLSQIMNTISKFVIEISAETYREINHAKYEEQRIMM